MAYCVYIIYSQTSERFYCGQTDNLERRLRQHNDPDNQSARTTKVFSGPWELLWHGELESRSEAMILEKRIKKRGIKRFLDSAEMAESRRRRD
ncbi:MAG: GIY-YIG nuclease family protein [Planctomycetales bacterium]|nr:GIY-YIG nuclease family protein [bacterium]UNM07003.1 MAG: GIY-YIG nuclease family protein [Planctomycetales bacterium]